MSYKKCDVMISNLTLSECIAGNTDKHLSPNMQEVDSRDCYENQMPHQPSDVVQSNPFQPIDSYHVQSKPSPGHQIQTTNLLLEPTQRPTVIESNQPHVIECT